MGSFVIYASKPWVSQLIVDKLNQTIKGSTTVMKENDKNTGGINPIKRRELAGLSRSQAVSSYGSAWFPNKVKLPVDR